MIEKCFIGKKLKIDTDELDDKAVFQLNIADNELIVNGVFTSINF